MSERDFTIGYTNYRGEYRQRRIRPLTIWFGATEWHEGEQWFLSALDLEKGSARYFALKDVEFPSARADAAEARVKVLEEALTAIHLKLAPQADRNFDGLLRDAMHADDIARAALASKEEGGG